MSGELAVVVNPHHHHESKPLRQGVNRARPSLELDSSRRPSTPKPIEEGAPAKNPLFMRRLSPQQPLIVNPNRFPESLPFLSIFKCPGYPELCQNGTLRVTRWVGRGHGGDTVGAWRGKGGATGS